MVSLRRLVMGSVRDAANRLGISIERVTTHTCPFRRTAVLCERLGTTLVIDVGANEGQYARQLRRAGYRGRIVSFEPLESAYRRLVVAAREDPDWIAAKRMALGERNGCSELHVAGNSVSSSLRPMTEAHVTADSSSQVVAVEIVPVGRLDEVYGPLRTPADRGIVLKLDVQGHEDKVLAGASGLQDSIAAVQMEMSFTELYEGQSLFHDQCAAMRSLGYDIWSMDRGFMNGKTGRLLQCDATFVRTSLFGET